MDRAMITLRSERRLMPLSSPIQTLHPAMQALTIRMTISTPKEGVMPNTLCRAASTVGREMHMVTAVQNSRPRMKKTSVVRPISPSVCLPSTTSAAELMRSTGLRRIWNM